MMLVRKLVFLLVFSSVFTLGGTCQAQNNTGKLSDTLRLDSSVKIGKLKNGFTYYIRINVEPKNRALL